MVRIVVGVTPTVITRVAAEFDPWTIATSGECATAKAILLFWWATVATWYMAVAQSDDGVLFRNWKNYCLKTWWTFKGHVFVFNLIVSVHPSCPWGEPAIRFFPYFWQCFLQWNYYWWNCQTLKYCSQMFPLLWPLDASGDSRSELLVQKGDEAYLWEI